MADTFFGGLLGMNLHCALGFHYKSSLKLCYTFGMYFLPAFLLMVLSLAGYATSPGSQDCNQAMAVMVDNSSPGRYDRTEGNYFASAEVMPNEEGYTGKEVLGQRTLDITMYLKQADGRAQQLRGKEEYQRILKHFEGRFDQILASWVESPLELSDNLDTFNALTRTGMAPELAAFQTWSGQRASENGYTRVKIKHMEGTLGHYTDVKIIFTKPQ